MSDFEKAVEIAMDAARVMANLPRSGYWTSAQYAWAASIIAEAIKIGMAADSSTVPTGGVK